MRAGVLVTAASGADQPTLRDQLDVDRLAERLRDLTYRGRNMTGPEAATYARFLLPLIEADRERAKAEAACRCGCNCASDLR